jgi:hypothetical protein
MRAAGNTGRMAAIDHADRGAGRDNHVQGQNADRRSATNLRATFAGRGVRACLDQGTLRPATIPLSRTAESHHGSHVGMPDLQPNALVRSAAFAASANRIHHVSASMLKLERSWTTEQQSRKTSQPCRRTRPVSLQRLISSHVPVPTFLATVFESCMDSPPCQTVDLRARQVPRRHATRRLRFRSGK